MQKIYFEDGMSSQQRKKVTSNRYESQVSESGYTVQEIRNGLPGGHHIRVYPEQNEQYPESVDQMSDKMISEGTIVVPIKNRAW